jgi:hypothetical protein
VTATNSSPTSAPATLAAAVKKSWRPADTIARFSHGTPSEYPRSGAQAPPSLQSRDSVTGP